MTALLIVAAIVTPVALLHRWHREPPPDIPQTRCPDCQWHCGVFGEGPTADWWRREALAAHKCPTRGEVAS